MQKLISRGSYYSSVVALKLLGNRWNKYKNKYETKLLLGQEFGQRRQKKIRNLEKKLSVKFLTWIKFFTLIFFR